MSNRNINKLKKIFEACGQNCDADTNGTAIDHLEKLAEEGKLSGKIYPSALYAYKDYSKEYLIYTLKPIIELGEYEAISFSNYNETGSSEDYVPHVVKIEVIEIDSTTIKILEPYASGVQTRNIKEYFISSLMAKDFPADKTSRRWCCYKSTTSTVDRPTVFLLQPFVVPREYNYVNFLYIQKSNYGYKYYFTEKSLKISNLTELEDGSCSFEAEFYSNEGNHQYVRYPEGDLIFE